MLSFWCLLPEYSVWDSRLLHETKTHSKITIYNLIILKLLILSENFRFTFFYYGLDSVDLYLKLLTRFFQPFINSVCLLPKGHCSAEFVIWLRKKLGICNSHRWKTFVFDAMFCRLATMGVANSCLLMLPNSEIRQNEGEWMPSGLGIYWDAKTDLFLREFRCLPCCACCAWGMFLLSPHESMLRMCGGYVCTLNCVKYRFIIRFIVALPVEPWLSVQRCERTCCINRTWVPPSVLIA